MAATIVRFATRVIEPFPLTPNPNP